LDHVRTRKVSDLIDKFTNWEMLQSLASEIISPRIQFNSGVEADTAAHDFLAITASACKLLTNKTTLSDLNNDLLGLESLLKHKRRSRKLWQVVQQLTVSQKPSYELTCRKTLNQWEIQIGNCEITPQAMA
jgi:hypothetical protein